MTTYTNDDPALPIEDLSPAQPDPATIEVDDLNQFVKLLARWHTQKIKVLEHLLKMEGGIEMQIGEEEVVQLEGDVLKGVKAGIQLALMEMGKLPFAVEYEQEPQANVPA